jgi:hypothetical protein
MDMTVVRRLLAIKASRSDSRFGERCLRFNALSSTFSPFDHILYQRVS